MRVCSGFEPTSEYAHFVTTWQVGDVIRITRRDVGDGWWEGELDGVYGLFPEKYVVLVWYIQHSMYGI